MASMIPIIVAGILAFSVFRPGPIPPGIYAVVASADGQFVRMDTRTGALELCTFVSAKEFECAPLEQKGKI